MYSALPEDFRIILATPEGFSIPTGYAIRLLDELHGSPQASRIWPDKAEYFLISTLGFQESSIDPSYYWRRDGSVLRKSQGLTILEYRPTLKSLWRKSRLTLYPNGRCLSKLTKAGMEYKLITIMQTAYY